MDARPPFVLLDDARETGAADAHYLTNPEALFVARQPGEVGTVMASANAARIKSGGTLAGYIAYEAGLALEPRLAPRAAKRNGAAGPLVWLGLFNHAETIPAADIPAWLAARTEAHPPAQIGPLEPQISLGQYQQAFAQMQTAINNGDIYQANLTFPLSGSFKGDPLALYTRLRPTSAAGYGGLVFDGQHWLLSLSPEMFVALNRDQLKAKPMKGTRPRGATPEDDRAFARELASSEKDRAENLMILDLMRNDLSKVAVPGSVCVDRPFAVETYPTLHQMTSTIRASLAPENDAMEVLRALFPCGSITGAPKIRAMELIDEIEPFARGPYCGAIGRIGPTQNGNGEAAFNVAIRTLRLTPCGNGQGKAVLGVGSAIVADSEAMSEWRECLVKGGFVRQSSPKMQAANFDLIETMRFVPDQGVVLLDLHLDRIAQSAAELGFAFDRHEARNSIQALCFDLEGDARLRLCLARSGAMALQASPAPGVNSQIISCAILPLPVDASDWRLRHKSSDRGFYEDALTVARQAGGEEALLMLDDGRLTEGSFSNIFVEHDGVLLTPPAQLGLLPGVLRRSLIEKGAAREAELGVADLDDGFFIGNALRGLIPSRLLGA